MKAIKRLINLPSILLVSFQVWSLKLMAKEADKQLYRFCEKGCARCDGFTCCKKADLGCEAARAKDRLEVVLEALSDYQTKLMKLWG